MKKYISTLYELQLLDDQLDELQASLGDLPASINHIKEEIRFRESGIEERRQEIEDIKVKIEKNKEEAEKLKETINKSQKERFSVRSNKVYDALSKQIDHAEDTIKKMTLENDHLSMKSVTLAEDIELMQPEIKDMHKELAEKEAELAEIQKASEKERKKLEDRRAAVEAQIKKPDLSTYLRVRKARGGKAVATIKRESCSGCHSVIRPNNLLEIRKEDKIHTCEYCGRILISDRITEEVEKEFSI